MKEKEGPNLALIILAMVSFATFVGVTSAVVHGVLIEEDCPEPVVARAAAQDARWVEPAPECDPLHAERIVITDLATCGPDEIGVAHSPEILCEWDDAHTQYLCWVPNLGEEREDVLP